MYNLSTVLDYYSNKDLLSQKKKETRIENTETQCI